MEIVTMNWCACLRVSFISCLLLIVVFFFLPKKKLVFVSNMRFSLFFSPIYATTLIYRKHIKIREVKKIRSGENKKKNEKKK